MRLLLATVCLASLVALAGCAASAAKPLTTADVVAAFRAAGLEVGDARPMTRDDYGMAPLATEGTRFYIPSLGPDNGGRVMRFDTPAEAEKSVEYYTRLGKASAAFYSHVFVKGTIVVQINGKLPDEKAKAYQAAMP